MNITEIMADFTLEADYNNLPAEVIDAAKYFSLDYLGIATRGVEVESSVNITKFIESITCKKETYIIGTNKKVNAHYAALVNGASSHSLELDDVVNKASLHPGTVIFSTVFALGPQVEASGEDIITAVVLGYEAMIKLGAAVNPTAHYARGFHPTGTCGVFGATISAAKLLGLDKAQIISALGIAGSMASGSMQYLANGAWNKRFHSGWAAHNGIIAATMAKKGFMGAVEALEGNSGFLRAYSDRPNPDIVLNSLGNPYEIMETSVKPHACCRYNQAPIDCTIELMDKHKLSAEVIEKVNVGLLKTGTSIVAEPENLKKKPSSIVDAQFSLPFAIALAVIKKNASLDEYNMDNIKNEEITNIMNRVSYYHDDRLERKYPEKWPAEVIIENRKGEQFYSYLEYPKGDPENPLTWEEMIYKFKTLTSLLYSDDRLDYIVEKIRSLEKLKCIEIEEIVNKLDRSFDAI